MKYVIGGLGDMLQVIDSAKKEESIKVYTHFGKAKELFEHHQIKAEVVPFDNNSEYIPIGEPLERKFYNQIDWIEPDFNLVKDYKRVIGIHAIGSDFSNAFWAKQGMPLKMMTRAFINELYFKLANGETLFLFFTSPKDAPLFETLIEQDRLIHSKVIGSDDIMKDISAINLCDILIGVDSAFKTVACMANVPSIVLVGDYQDDYRDQQFLNPYVNDGIMKVVRFKEMDEGILEKVLKALEEYGNR